MQHDYWHSKWATSQIRFHRPVTNRYLEKYGKRFPIGKVLVPLCGKSLDIKWLEASGREVMGIELSPIACAAYFEEQGRSVYKSKERNFEKYSDGKAVLWCGDFFALEPDDCSDVVAIYDQACLIAFPPEMRLRYVEHLRKILPGRTVPLLLNTMEYPQNQMDGPPFSVSQVDVERYFAPFITVLESMEVSPTLFEKVPKLIEKSYWIEHGRI
jgi:thiopurine S-methyltransferase